MHSLNNELVKAGHDFAAAISNDTPIIEIAKMVANLATALDDRTREVTAYEATVTNLTAQVQGLAAENGKMLRLLTDISDNHGEFVNEEDDYMYASVPLDYVSEINMYVSRDVNAENPFEHTDAALAEIRAQGVDALSKFAGQEYQRHTGDKAMQRKWKGVVLLCTGFASELRKEQGK